MRIQRVPTTRGYDLFKAAVTFILLFAVLVAVVLSSGSTQAAEQAPPPTQVPAIDLPPTIGESAVVAGCIELSGTGTAGAKIQIRSDDNILGSVKVSEDGTWSLITCVNPGNFQLVAVTINETGAEVNRSVGLVVLVPAPTPVPTPVEAIQPAAEGSRDGQDYLVEQGDWLLGLAREFYGDASRSEDIYYATNAKAAEDPSYATIDNPNILEPGWKIWIPFP